MSNVNVKFDVKYKISRLRRNNNTFIPIFVEVKTLRYIVKGDPMACWTLGPLALG